MQPTRYVMALHWTLGVAALVSASAVVGTELPLCPGEKWPSQGKAMLALKSPLLSPATGATGSEGSARATPFKTSNLDYLQPENYWKPSTSVVQQTLPDRVGPITKFSIASGAVGSTRSPIGFLEEPRPSGAPGALMAGVTKDTGLANFGGIPIQPPPNRIDDLLNAIHPGKPDIWTKKWTQEGAFKKTPGGILFWTEESSAAGLGAPVIAKLNTSAQSVDIRMKISTPSEADALRWSSTRDTLRELTSGQQEVAIRAAGLAGPKADLKQLSMSEFSERLDRVSNLSEMFALDQALDPRVRDALFANKPKNPTDSEWVAISESSDVRLWATRAASARKFARKFGGDPTVQVIGSGEGTEAGGLGGVPRGVPVAVDLANGKACVRPMRPSDWLFDEAKMSIGRRWDPSAFPDVGALMWRRKGTGIDGINLCSFVRMSATHVLTVAHCVVTKSPAGGWRAVEFGSASLEAIALLPQLADGNKDPAACFDKPTTCGFYVTRVSSRGIVPKSMQWDAKSSVPEPDVALLTVEFTGARAPTTGVIDEKTPLEQITLAGYGITNGAGGGYSGDLRVGWQRRPPRLDATTLVWAVEPAGGFAGACDGDSGGAVFAGDVAVPTDSRVLAGVVSFGTGGSPATGVDRCMQMASGTATRLEPLRPWLCESSANSILGCAPQ